MATTIDTSKIDADLSRVWGSPEDLRAYHNDLKAEAKRLTDLTEKDLKAVNAGAKLSTQMTSRLHELQRASDAVDYVNKRIDDAGPVDARVDIDEPLGYGPEGTGPSWYDGGGQNGHYTAVPGRAKFQDLFGTPRANPAGLRTFAELTGAIARRDWSRLQGAYDSRAAVGAVPSEGGFLIGEQFAAQLLDVALDAEVVRPRARVYPMRSSQIKIPGYDIGSHASNNVSGIVPAWKNEDAAFTADQFQLRQVRLTANKVGVFSQASSELLEDADVPTFSEDLQAALVRVIRHRMDSDFLNGDGAGKPMGVLNAACTVAVTAGSAGSIKYADLTGMFSRLHPASYASSVWVAHPSTIPKLAALTVSGTTDSGWVQVATGRAGGFNILTRPVVFTERVPALGSNGSLLLCDFSAYGIGMRREVRMISTQAVDFANDRTSWLVTVRVDGQPLWSEALTPQNGSDTLSPFVKLNDS